MYYVMSIPEVLVLLFVLVLWMISIFFCYKRYEKINTIERADMPNMSLKNANQSMETQSCHSLSKNNVTNSCQNITPAAYTCSLRENNSFNEPSDAFGTNNSIFCNNYLFEKQHEPNCPSLYFIDETNARTSRIELISYQKYQKYRKYHQNFNIYTSQQQAPRLISRPYLSQFRALMGQSLSRKNLESQGYLTNSKSDMSKQELRMLKSSSEPALKELLIEPKKATVTANLVHSNLIKSNSICNDDEVNQDEIKSKLADKRSRLLYNNKSLNDNNLIDPHKIPKVIQKSLIDLHKKSMWNLAHRPQASEKTSTQSKNPLNFLHLHSKSKSKEINSSQNNLSRVITQMKNGNEIKMKINDN